MQDTLRGMREKRAGGDQGFTLIELLVVVVIIGVLVAIAIPMYMNYKKGAENKSAMADVRTAITAIEQCYTDNANQYPASFSITTKGGSQSLTCGTGNTEQINTSPGNTLDYVSGATGYTIAVTNGDTGKKFTYDSSTGKIT
jgi:type IV pilus assembly protein PilA